MRRRWFWALATGGLLASQAVLACEEMPLLSLVQTRELADVVIVAEVSALAPEKVSSEPVWGSRVWMEIRVVQVLKGEVAATTIRLATASICATNSFPDFGIGDRKVFFLTKTKNKDWPWGPVRGPRAEEGVKAVNLEEYPFLKGK